MQNEMETKLTVKSFFSFKSEKESFLLAFVDSSPHFLGL